ncbi:hypothetical protein BC830DRAFT_1159803 [Chytriomyces sp. MP71]|nr:hypothetical protein BC830DRAFT_1159803 [Chytriomyces sp. MP71]
MKLGDSFRCVLLVASFSRGVAARRAKCKPASYVPDPVPAISNASSPLPTDTYIYAPAPVPQPPAPSSTTEGPAPIPQPVSSTGAILTPTLVATTVEFSVTATSTRDSISISQTAVSDSSTFIDTVLTTAASSSAPSVEATATSAMSITASSTVVAVTSATVATLEPAPASTSTTPIPPQPDQIPSCSTSNTKACGCTIDNIPACASIVPFDQPPVTLEGADVITQCLGLANYARQLYNPGVANLVWSDALAKHAANSAKYSATNKCWDCHTESGPGFDWGQNLYLSKGSCWDSYFGWVTDEAAGPTSANPDQGHFKNVVGLALSWSSYASIGCASATVDGATATVCNYGLSLVENY